MWAFEKMVLKGIQVNNKTEMEFVIRNIDFDIGDFDEDFFIKRLYVDCKHKEKGFSQLMRIIGLSKIFDFEECFAIRETITREVRYFGNKYGIKLLEKTFFDSQKELLQSGSSTVKTYEKKQELISFLGEKENREIKRNFLFSTQRAILESDPYKRFKIIRQITNDLLRKLAVSDSKQKELLQVCYILEPLSLMLQIMYKQQCNVGWKN